MTSLNATIAIIMFAVFTSPYWTGLLDGLIAKIHKS